ncbi:hypothetical protein [Sulfurimonas sp.]|uniref:hypothetical protein n=1 Tax=Sulfurimonas sp. TaxID=2022749 RepID=UPI0025D1B39B|nr:hypothetical protein [Sulfurimonas sp.]MBW6488392.1 hypothetical protein [Sulfurimonas sp.]
MLKYRHRKYLFFNCPNETDRGVRINRYMHLEFGFGRRDLYGVDDLISMVFSIYCPSEDLRTQSTTELFYRYDVYYGVQLTVSMQIINNS